MNDDGYDLEEYLANTDEYVRRGPFRGSADPSILRTITARSREEAVDISGRRYPYWIDESDPEPAPAPRRTDVLAWRMVRPGLNWAAGLRWNSIHACLRVNLALVGGTAMMIGTSNSGAVTARMEDMSKYFPRGNSAEDILRMLTADLEEAGGVMAITPTVLSIQGDPSSERWLRDFLLPAMDGMFGSGR